MFNLKHVVHDWVVEPVLSFVAPAQCLICGEPLLQSHKVVCQSCYGKISPLDPAYLESLRDEIRTPYFDDLIVCYPFDQTFQYLIHLLKYQRQFSVAELFGESLAHFVPLNFDLVTAVPLNPARYKERGYNQSELIAKQLSNITRIPLSSNLLIRLRNTQSQTKLSREERKQNVKDAFTINGEVEGKRILLIDDVITTGSTLNECARELKKNGASWVTAAALATPTDFFQSDDISQMDVGDRMLNQIHG
ncbi:ComF family protein [Calditrichota bacterium GD2]